MCVYFYFLYIILYIFKKLNNFDVSDFINAYL